MNTIETMFGSKLEDFIDKEIPGLNLSIVEHGCVLEFLGLSISSIANVSSTVFIEIVQEKIFILSVVSA